VDTYTETVLTSKVVRFIVSSEKTGKSATTVILGDSFTDGYNITKYIHEFVTTRQANTLKCIGLNESGVVGVKDDAWSGYGYEFYYDQPLGYLRNDRPLSDGVWDVSWGENEVNGWSTGQTYADLTAEQKSHGKTRNQFYNPETKLFDFSYYMNTYMDNQNVDSVVILNGLNDAIWNGVNTLKSKLPTLMLKVKHIVDSIKTYDSNIKILLHTVTPQTKDQVFFSKQGKMLHYETAKYSQELFNESLLDLYGDDTSVANGIYVMPSSANFDTRFSILMGNYYPDKFNLDYMELHPYDVHPNSTGAKYIADTVYNYLYSVVIK